MNDNSIILLGNGFDISLGLATTYKDYINWIRECHLKSKISKTQEKIVNSAYDFVQVFEKWKQNKGISNNSWWSDLETDLLPFFTEKLYFKDNKTRISGSMKFEVTKKDWEKVVSDYSRFCFSMQSYYLTIPKSIKGKDKRKLIFEKLKLFDSEDIASNDNVISIISLNYTFPYEFTGRKLPNKEKVIPKIYLLHYSIFTNNLYDFISSLLKRETLGAEIFKKFKNFGNVEKFTELSCQYIDSKKRKEIAYPLTRRTPLKRDPSEKKAYDPKNIQTEYYYFQYLILGNESVKNKDLSFLSKSEGDFLCVQNYPKTILKIIDKKISDKKIIQGHIYVFGYSFGSGDLTINEWLKNKISRGWKINLCFWKEDEGKAFIRSAESNLKKFNQTSNYELIFW